MADDTTALLRQLDNGAFQKADFFGYSGGANVALLDRADWLLSMIGEFLDVPTLGAG